MSVDGSNFIKIILGFLILISLDVIDNRGHHSVKEHFKKLMKRVLKSGKDDLERTYQKININNF